MNKTICIFVTALAKGHIPSWADGSGMELKVCCVLPLLEPQKWLVQWSTTSHP